MTKRQTSTDKSKTTGSTTTGSEVTDEAPKAKRATCGKGIVLSEKKWSGIPMWECPKCGSTQLKSPTGIECKYAVAADAETGE